MFNPKFDYTNKLIRNISTISELVGSLKEQRFPKPVLLEMLSKARALSVYSSTTIEGNSLPLTDVKKILKNKPKNARASEKEIINYNKALIELNKQINTGDEISINHNFINNIQKEVTKDLVTGSNLGNYRNVPVFVNDPRKNETTYLPPDHSDIMRLMKELIEFINSNKSNIDYLILSGIFHKQFVIIHPYFDGNGRTARLVTKALLAHMGLDTFNLFSFENYYNNNITRYFEKVGVRGNYYNIKDNIDFSDWLEYFTEGIIDELLRVKDLLSKPISLKSKLEDHHKMIINLIKEYGVIKDSDYAKHTSRSKASRALDFQKLQDLKLIERRGAGRSTHYVRKGG